MRKLSDESAKPRPDFILKLQKQVVEIASGQTPPPKGFNRYTTLGLISGLIVVSSVTAFLGINKANRKVDIAKPTTETILVQTSEADSEVLAKSTTQETTQESQEEGSTSVNESANYVNLDTNIQESTATASTSNPQPETIKSITEQELFTVSFWNLQPFKLPPLRPNSEPNLVKNNVESIDYDWVTGSPGSQINTDYFYAKAEQNRIFEPGKYKIDFTCDDGVRMYLDDKLIYDRWSSNVAGTVDSATFNITSERSVNLVVEYYENVSNATFKFKIVKI
jgi:hypothetical protein